MEYIRAPLRPSARILARAGKKAPLEFPAYILPSEIFSDPLNGNGALRKFSRMDSTRSKPKRSQNPASSASFIHFDARPFLENEDESSLPRGLFVQLGMSQPTL